MNNRMLGAGGIVGGLALLFIELRHVVSGVLLTGANLDATDEVGYLICGLGLVCAFWSIYAFRATGRNPILRAVPILVVIGGLTMAIGSLTEVLGMTVPNANPIFFVSWPLVIIGTVFTAILALVARTWEGWHKFAPLFVILSIPLLLLLSQVVGHYGDWIFGFSWVLLGVAVYTTPDTTAAPERSAAAI